MVKIWKTKGDAFYQSDFAIDAFDKATGYSVNEKIEDFSLPILEGFAKTIQCLAFQLSSIIQPSIKIAFGDVWRCIRLIPLVKPLAQASDLI